MIRLFKSHDERTLPRIQQIEARHRIPRLDPVAHTLPAHIDRRRKARTAQRLHIHSLPAVLTRLRDDARLLCTLPAQLHHHTHRVALRHHSIATLRLHEHHFRARNTVQICRRPQRPQEQSRELPTRRRHHRAHHTKDRSRVAEIPPHQLYRQQARHLHPLHPARYIILQKCPKLLRIKHLALRLSQLHRREQILPQPRLCMFNEPRQLPRIGRMKQPRQTLPPSNHQHREIRRAGKRPPQPIRHPHLKIDGRDNEHREQQHRERRKDTASHDQAPPPGRESA